MSPTVQSVQRDLPEEGPDPANLATMSRSNHTYPSQGNNLNVWNKLQAGSALGFISYFDFIAD
jgi:hypothetical protein